MKPHSVKAFSGVVLLTLYASMLPLGWGLHWGVFALAAIASLPMARAWVRMPLDRQWDRTAIENLERNRSAPYLAWGLSAVLGIVACFEAEAFRLRVEAGIALACLVIGTGWFVANRFFGPADADLEPVDSASASETSPLTRAQTENWARTRARGLLRFVLAFGVGRLGVGFYALFSVADYLTRYGWIYEPIWPEHFLRWIPGSIAFGVVAGVVHYGFMEKLYRMTLANRDREQIFS